MLSRRTISITGLAALAMPVLLCLGAGFSTASAQDGDPIVEKHLALIIANQDYVGDGGLKTGPADMPPPGFLKDLANPCRDAALFQQTLLDAQWQPEEIIFPPCNQTAPQMRALIADFREKVANTTKTLAIFYYSGHGAQFSDADTNHSFLFGVGAKLDLAALADSWRNSPRNTSAIANQALDLDELTSPLGGQPENAVFIILDACRDNPLYNQINEVENAPPIAALGAPRDFNGILIAYSTPHGEFSGDGFGKHSVFTSVLVEELRPGRNLDSSLNSLRKDVDIAYRKAYPQRTNSQIPVVTGRFSGDWCLTQCPPPTNRAPVATRAFANPSSGRQILDDAEIDKTGPEVRRASLTQLSFRTSLSPSPPSSYAVTRGSPKNAVRQIAAAVPSQAAPASQASAFTRTIYDRDADNKDYSAPARSGMHFDVFWCDGGDGSDEREKHALNIASSLGQEAVALDTATLPATDSNRLQINQSIASVRLRRLTATANTTFGFRYSDNVIVYDRNDANEAAWSKVVSKLGGPDLNQYGDTANTPNYMSIFVCRSPRPRPEAKTLIYLQVPSDSLKPLGHLLLKDLTHLVPTVKDAGGIETRGDGPLSTELRFYNEGERDSVFATAKAMEQVLGRPVKVQFIPRLANAGTAGHMEIWLGRSDPPLDEKALKAVFTKKDSKE